MTRDEVFPSKYLKAADLKGKAYVATIESAPYETLQSLDGKETQKIVLHFKNAEKTLPLNVTNFDAVCDATGFPDTEDWRDSGSSCTRPEQLWEERRSTASASVRLPLHDRRQRHHRRQSLAVK